MNAEGPSPTRPGLIVLAYLPVLGLLALAASGDREVRWHARNGLALFGAALAIGILGTLAAVLAPSLSCLYAVAMAIAAFLYVSIAVLAAVKALQGQRLMIPLISIYASRLSARD
ncbi:MAG TPA: hypothetical protein VGG65_08745 [Thermoanaerobaculia bacterium]|jgi:uncharacterized membrane protein